MCLWVLQRLPREDHALWLAELENPLGGRKQAVSPKVVEEEMAQFMRAQAILGPGG